MTAILPRTRNVELARTILWQSVESITLTPTTMKRILTSVAFLVALTLLTPVVLAQSDPITVSEEGDASHLFGEAQNVGYPLSANPLVVGEISFFEDCDAYEFAASTSASHYVASVWSKNELLTGTNAPMYTNLFTQLSTSRRNWENGFAGFGQPLVRALMAPGESLGVIDCNNDARYIDDPDGAEVYDPELKTINYELIVPAIRYLPSVHVVGEESHRIEDVTAVLDCTGGGAHDAIYMRYDNPTAGFDPGERKAFGFYIPSECLHVGLKGYGNKPVDLTVLLEDGSTLPLGDCSQKRDDDDPTIPDINSSLNFKDWGAVMPASAGENVCLRHVPSGSGAYVFAGSILRIDGDTPRDEGDCDTCVRELEDVGPERFSDTMVMIINPEVSISGVKITGSGANEVTASFDVPAAAQVLGYSLTHVGSARADTLVTVTDETADTEFRHLSSRSYDLTLDGLPSGEAEFTLCALGRGTYSDLDPVPGSCVTRSATVPVANEDGPSGSTQFALSVYPNPARESTTAHLVVPTAEWVRIAVYDVLGREVSIVHDGALQAGTHTFTARLDLAAGVYLVRATSDASATATERITVAR